MRRGKPLERFSQITDRASLNRALEALLYGGDEYDTNTQANCAPMPGPGSFKMFYEDKVELDNLISESLGENPMPLPSGELLEKIGHVQDKLYTWFAMPGPKWERRIVRESINELANLANAVREGTMDANVAQAQFDAILSENMAILDWEKYINNDSE